MCTISFFTYGGAVLEVVIGERWAWWIGWERRT